MSYLSVRSRNRLLWLASILERRAKGLRKYVKAKTPPRKKRGARPAEPSPQVDIEQAIAQTGNP